MSDTTITLPAAFRLKTQEEIECITCEQVHVIADFFWDTGNSGIEKVKMKCPSCGASSTRTLGGRIRNFLIGATMPYWREG